MVLRVAFFELHVVEVKASDVDAARCACLEAENLDASLLQVFGESDGGSHAVRAAGVHGLADDDFAVEVGACAEDDCLGAVFFMEFGRDADAFAVFDDDVHDLDLFEVKIICVFNDFLHVAVVFALVGLGAQGIDSRAFSKVEHAHLDGGSIGSDAHFSSQCVDFLDEMALARSADGRVAGHHGHVLE